VLSVIKRTTVLNVKNGWEVKNLLLISVQINVDLATKRMSVSNVGSGDS
jgi:hypothetical protein